MNPEQPALITRITPSITQPYLQNVAEALNNTIIPGLEGATRARAMDCLRIVSRLISDSTLSDTTLEILRNGTAGEKVEPLAEGKAIENANREGGNICAACSCLVDSGFLRGNSRCCSDNCHKKHLLPSERKKTNLTCNL